MLFRRLQQKTRLAFATVAVPAILPLPFGRVVGTEIKSIDMGTEMSQLRLQVLMQDLNRLRLEVSPCDPCLIGDDQHHEPGSIQTGNGLGSTGDEFKILDPVQVAFIHIDGAVAVEENRSAERFSCEG